MAKEKEYAGPFEVRGRQTSGAPDGLLSVHNDLEAAKTGAQDAIDRIGFQEATVIDRPTQEAVHTVQRETPPA